MEEKIDGFLEGVIQAIGQAGNGFGFNAENALGGFKTHRGNGRRSRRVGQLASRGKLTLIENVEKEPNSRRNYIL